MTINDNDKIQIALTTSICTARSHFPKPLKEPATST